GLLVLPEPVMGHGQEGQDHRGTVTVSIGCREGLDRLPVTAGAVEGRSEADAIVLPIGGQAAGVLRLEPGEVIREGVEIGLADEAPGRSSCLFKPSPSLSGATAGSCPRRLPWPGPCRPGRTPGCRPWLYGRPACSARARWPGPTA